MFRTILTVSVRLVFLAVAAYHLGFKPWRRRWQADQHESERLLPGDELVPDAQFVQTMAVTIGAPPSVVWPWLVQLGYGRGGWYSYDAIDMLGSSSREVRPDWQDLSVGQEVPLGPGLGLRVEVMDPERALVLYGDSSEMKKESTDGATPGMKLVGVLGDANMRAFEISWAFVLDELEGGRTRLLERFRTRTVPGPAAVIVTPLIDVGHFLMTRKHMLGVKERAEGNVHGVAPTAPAVTEAIAA